VGVSLKKPKRRQKLGKKKKGGYPVSTEGGSTAERLRAAVIKGSVIKKKSRKAAKTRGAAREREGLKKKKKHREQISLERRKISIYDLVESNEGQKRRGRGEGRGDFCIEKAHSWCTLRGRNKMGGGSEEKIDRRKATCSRNWGRRLPVKDPNSGEPARKRSYHLRREDSAIIDRFSGKKVQDGAGGDKVSRIVGAHALKETRAPGYTKSG